MNLSVDAKVSLAGQYRMSVKRPDGSVVETHWFDNMILNAGLDMIGDPLQVGGGSLVAYASVGTGTTAPSATQTQLNAHLATSGGSSFPAYENSGAPLYEGTQTFTYVFAQGSVVGNISEIGTGPTNDGSSLFSRSRIVDSGGNPTTLSVTALDELTVFYRITFKPNLATQTGSFQIGSTTYNYTAKLGSAETFGGGWSALIGGSFATLYNVQSCGENSVLGTILEGATDPLENSASIVAADYVQGSYQRTSTAVYDYNRANQVTGLKGFNAQFGPGYGSPCMNFQYLLNNPIIKNNTQELRLSFNISWARAV
jgi:hypothetical protein